MELGAYDKRQNVLLDWSQLESSSTLGLAPAGIKLDPWLGPSFSST